MASVLGAETVPAAPETEADTLCSSYPVDVTLTNPNGSGDIYYTLDGSAPTRSRGIVYNGPIRIPASVTLKAAAWPDGDGVSSPVLVCAFKTLAEALGTHGVVWSVGGDCKWVLDASAAGTVMAPNVSGRNYSCWIRAVTHGRGRLAFTLKGVSYSSVNRVGFSVNGVQQYSYGYSLTYGTSRTVTLTNEVVSAGETTYTWTYGIQAPDHNHSVCGAWLSDVRWIPDGAIEPGGETAYTPDGWTTPIAVGNDWLIAQGLAKEGDPADVVAVMLAAKGRNGIPRYQSYLLGLEPDSDRAAEDQLRVTLRGFDDNGLPIVDYEPKPNDATRVRYVQVGKPDLSSGGDWIEVSDENRSVLRFYRVKVVITP